MAIHGAFTKPYIYIGGYKISPELVEAQIKYGHDVKQITTFGQDTAINTPGLSNISFSGNGWVNAADNAQEEQVAANVGLSNVAVSFMPTNTPVAGDPALFFKALTSNYEVGGSIGDVLGFNFDMMGGDGGYPLCRGWVLEPGTASKTETGATTGQDLGGIGADQYLYAVLHVFSVSASDTIDVIIQSDDNVGFTSATNRITFTQASAIEGQFATRVSGAITDNYWRAYYTIAGTDPAISFACSMAIHSKKQLSIGPADSNAANWADAVAKTLTE